MNPEDAMTAAESVAIAQSDPSDFAGVAPAEEQGQGRAGTLGDTLRRDTERLRQEAQKKAEVIADALRNEARSGVRPLSQAEEQELAALNRALRAGPAGGPVVFRDAREADFKTVAIQLFDAAIEDGWMTDSRWADSANALLAANAISSIPSSVLKAAFRDVFADVLRVALEQRYGMAATTWADGQCSVRAFVPVRQFFTLRDELRQLRMMMRGVFDQGLMMIGQTDPPASYPVPERAWTGSSNSPRTMAGGGVPIGGMESQPMRDVNVQQSPMVGQAQKRQYFADEAGSG